LGSGLRLTFKDIPFNLLEAVSESFILFQPASHARNRTVPVQAKTSANAHQGLGTYGMNQVQGHIARFVFLAAT